MWKHKFKLDRKRSEGNHYVFVCSVCGSEHGIIKRAFKTMMFRPASPMNQAYWSRWKRLRDFSNDTCMAIETKPGTVDSDLSIWIISSTYRR